MARQVLPWVGAAVGSIWGQPQLGFAIGSIIGNAVDPQVIKGPALGEGQNNTASEGGYRPIVLGKGAVGVCMIHQGPEIIRTIRTRQSKGGGPKTEQDRRYRTMAFALGESAYPETGVQLLRLWFDNKLVYDVTPTSQIVAESAEFAERFTFYPGDETQEPDPDLEAMPVEDGGGVGNVPSYRGGCPYIVLPEWDVTDSAGRAPIIKAELATTTSYETRAIAIGRYGPVDYGTIQSEDGISWGPPIANTPVGRDNQSPHSTGLIPFGTRFIAWSAINSNYSDDFGATWSEPVYFAPGAWGGPRSTEIIASPSVLIPLIGSPFFAVSFDAGESYSNIGSQNIPAIALRGNTGMGFHGNGLGNAARSINNGASWSIVGNTGMHEHSDQRWMASSDDHFVLAGRDQSFHAAVSVTTTGDTWNVTVLTSDSGRRAYIVKWAKSGAHPDGRWVTLLDNGDIYYADDPLGTWTKCGDNLGGRFPTGLTHNGTRWIASGNTAGMSGGAIFTSEDGISWTQRSTAMLGIASVCALPGSGLFSSEKIPLSAIATWIHERVNIPSAKYNVTELTDLVEGIVFADGYTGQTAMQSAMMVYNFGAGEFDAGSGYKLNYVKHGKPAAMTLTEDDIVEGPEDWEREDSFERPRVLHVQYANPVADYGAPNIVIKRTSPDVLVVGERSVSVPFVFSDVDEITRRADVMMTVVYTEIAGTYKLVLPWSLLTLAPTDTIGFSIRGRTRRLRLDQWRFSPDGTISTEFMADRQSAWTSNVTGLPAVPSKPPPPSIVGPTISAVLDIPALADNLDSLHLIVAATGVSPAWYGSDHQRKLPSDSDFSTMLQFSGVTTIMGVLQADVTAASPHFTDTTNVVRVKLYRDDELVTYTQQQFLSENGAFALAWDDSGTRRWEVCQYRDAVKVGDAEWELTTLARGRLNTYAAAHPSGSLFVLLDAGVRDMPMQSPMLGQDVTHRAVSLGQLPDQAVPYTEAYIGESQREWPVAHLFLERDGDDIACKCVPRHRFGTNDNPIRSINWQGYRWTATDGVNTASVDTLIDTHTFDVTGWASPVTVTVSQINRITGAGPTVVEQAA